MLKIEMEVEGGSMFGVGVGGRMGSIKVLMEEDEDEEE